MKSRLLIMGVLCAIAFATNAQTKGTNTLGFGVNLSTSKPIENVEVQNNNFSIGYGQFIKDNVKIGFDLNYGNYEYQSSGINQKNYTYGGNLNYQKYYPLVKNLFVYAGGRAGYANSILKSDQGLSLFKRTTNEFNIGAFGGLTWFLSKRFALETSLLSANASYQKIKENNSTTGSNFSSENTLFNLNTQGFINDLGFKIYILF